MIWNGGILNLGEEEGDGQTLLINNILTTLFGEQPSGLPWSTNYNQHDVAQNIYAKLFDHSIIYSFSEIDCRVRLCLGVATSDFLTIVD